MDRDDGALEEIVNWVRSARTAPLGADLVPGTTARQRSDLAAVGGLVGSLVPRRTSRRWPDPLSAWVEGAPKPPGAIANALAGLLERDPDALAALYCELVAGANRRRLGTFFTPPSIVDFMLDKVTPHVERRTLVDPGAGVGAFALAAAIALPRVDVLAVDINVVTLGLLGAAAHRAGLRNVTLVHDDYLSWLKSEREDDGRPRLYVGNPPYTRHQELDRKLKKAMLEASQDLVTSRLAGLSAYFLAASFYAMAADDVLCFVLPSTWIEARYGRELRAWVWRETRRRVEMHRFPSEANVFPGTRVSAMVLYVGPCERGSKPLTFHRAIIANRTVSSTRPKLVERISDVPRSLGPLLWRDGGKSPAEHVSLSDIAKVRRGVATGANAFFFLTDAEAEALPHGAVRPALRRIRHVRGDVLDRAEHRRIGAEGKPRWLLMLDKSEVVVSPSVQRLLRAGRKAGVPHRYLAAVRDPWYLVEDVPPAHLLVTIMTKDQLRVVRNVAGVVHSNSIYGIYLRKPSLAKPLATWLNSDDGQLAMMMRTRHYSEGLRKLEPRDLAATLVPAPTVLTQ